MKNRTTLMLLLVFWPVIGGFVGELRGEEIENLIGNGSLEEGVQITEDNVPYPMKPMGNTPELEVAVYSLAQDEKTSGENSLCIERLLSSGAARVLVTKPGGVELSPGKRYVFSCMIKTTEGDASMVFGFFNSAKEDFFVEVTAVSEGAQVIGSGKNDLVLERRYAPNPDGFNKLEGTFTAPEEPVVASVCVNFNSGSGTAWLDDFCLVQKD